MSNRKRFAEFIKKFRAQGKIPLAWSTAEIRPLLRAAFPANTIGVFPNNYSASPDGRIRGDAVKRGMKPKFFRVGRGLFVLVEEFDAWKSGHTSSVICPPQKHDILEDTEAVFPRKPGKFNEALTRLPNRAGFFENKLLEAFPSKRTLIEYSDFCAREYRQPGASY
jgi:hypothetical protein